MTLTWWHVVGSLLSGVALGFYASLAWLTWHDRPPKIRPPASYQRFP